MFAKRNGGKLVIRGGHRAWKSRKKREESSPVEARLGASFARHDKGSTQGRQRRLGEEEEKTSWKEEKEGKELGAEEDVSPYRAGSFKIPAAHISYLGG